MARHPHRFKSTDYVGRQSYSLTFCGFDRQPRFADDVTARLVIDQLMRTARAESFDVNAYSVMTDHVHFVMTGRRDDSDLLAWIKRFRQKTGHEYKKRTGAFLWQEGYWDRTLRSDESVILAAVYTVSNPVRAGLVKIPSEYPYSGSETYSMEELSDLALRGDTRFND